jgi:hypothetical protein
VLIKNMLLILNFVKEEEEEGKTATAKNNV